MTRAELMDQVFSPIYTLFANSYLSVLDVLFLIVLAIYIAGTVSRNPKAPQIPLVVGLWIWLVGNTLSRIWVTLYRWLFVHGFETAWMSHIPVLPVGLGLVSVGLAWFVVAVVGARYGIFWALLYIAVALGFAALTAL